MHCSGFGAGSFMPYMAGCSRTMYGRFGGTVMNRGIPALIICLLLMVPLWAMGEAAMQVSGDHFTVGEVVDLEIQDAKDASCIYSVWLDGEKIFQTKEPDTHLNVSYRPRQEGNYEVRADLTLKSGEKQLVSAAFSVEAGEAEPEKQYSQRDGWWKNKSYKDSNLDAAGCAIFTLSHALHRMGIEGEETEPAALGKKYAFCLVKGGTSNVMLIREAGEAFVFQTRADLYENKNEIISQFRDGAMFSFSIVLGHIALAAELSPDESKVLIVDSAPGVTLERIKKGNMYYLDDKGKYVKFTDLADVPGSRYYLESQQWGGLNYYLDLSYVARRGVRLIKPYWLRLEENGESLPADMVSFGTVQCEITVNKASETVPTRALTWRSATETPMAAYITGTKGVTLTDRSGKKLKTIKGRSVMLVLGVEDDKVQVRYDEAIGYVPSKSVELLNLTKVTGTPGVLSLNGNVSGRATIRVRYNPGGKLMDNIKTGTPIVVLSEEKDYYQIEVSGRRGYVQKEYVTLPEE